MKVKLTVTSATVTYGECSIFVQGIEMNCPLCGVLVKSGTHHPCTKPEISGDEAKKLPRKRKGAS